MTVFLLLLALLPDENPALGTYDCDKKILLLNTVTNLTKSSGKLSKPQLKIIEDEVSAAELTITLAKNGRAHFVVNLGKNNKLDGEGNWELKGDVFTLTITHKYELRLERIRQVTGTLRKGRLALQLTKDLPELLFIKRVEKKDKKKP